MMRRLIVAASLSIALAPVLAQNTAAPAASHAASAPASSPAKKELVLKVLQLLQPGTEAMARGLVEQSLTPLMQQAGAALRSVPQEKRQAVVKDVQADIKKFADEAIPVVRDRAVKLAPTAIGPLLEERFTEDELKQLVAWLESPVTRKYQQVAPEMQKAMTEKLVADTRVSIEPKLRALQKSVGDRMGLGQPAQGASAASPAASGASKKTIPPAPKSSAARQ